MSGALGSNVNGPGGLGDKHSIPRFAVERFSHSLRTYQVGVGKDSVVRCWMGGARPVVNGHGADLYGREAAPKEKTV